MLLLPTSSSRVASALPFFPLVFVLFADHEFMSIYHKWSESTLQQELDRLEQDLDELKEENERLGEENHQLWRTCVGDISLP